MKKQIGLCILILNLFVLVGCGKKTQSHQSSTEVSSSQTSSIPESSSQSTSSSEISSQSVESKKEASAANSETASLPQEKSAEKKTYPDLSQYQSLKVTVSIDRQLMTIWSGETEIFTTVVSTGADHDENATPIGDFVIEPERGESFFNEESGEGALYWVSFKDHGIYLFHSIPTDRYGNELAEEAAKLGQPSSHGCVRMSRPDAKWFYQQIPQGTPVHIE